MKFRRIISGAAAAVTALSMAGAPMANLPVLSTAITAGAEDEGDLICGDFKYRFTQESADGVFITGYVGEGGEVVIPSELNGNTVVGTYWGAFSEYTSIKKLQLPKSDNFFMYPRSFAGCNGLTDIEIPDDSSFHIDDRVFIDCTALKTIDLSKCKEIYIGYFTFGSCNSLNNIKLPVNVGFGDRPFGECASLTDVYYAGTKAQWNEKVRSSIHLTGYGPVGDAVVHCSDGDVYPEGSESEKQSISKAAVKVANKAYTGKALKPAPKVTLDGKTLKNGTDYTVSYKNNKNCGKATVTVKGKGDYCDSKNGSFIIKPAKAAAKKFAAAKKGTAKLTWKKSAGKVDGYKIQISLDKKFKKSPKTYTVKKAAAVSKIITKLKSGKTYYARVCAYKKVGKTVYKGAWSAAEKAKIK